MGDDIIALLKAHEYFCGISDDTLREIAGIAQVSNYAAGAVVHQLDEPLTSICFVLRGRLKAVRVDAHGRRALVSDVRARRAVRNHARGPRRAPARSHFCAGVLDDPEPGSRSVDGVDVPTPRRASPMVPDLCAQRAAAPLRDCPQACAQRTRVASRIPRHAEPCSEAHPATAGVGGRDLRSQRRGHLAVDAGYAVSFAVRRGPTPRCDGDSPTNCRVATSQTRRVRCLGHSGPRADRAVDGRRSHLGLRATQRDSVGAPAVTIAGRDGARLARQDQYRVAAGRGLQRGPGGTGTP